MSEQPFKLEWISQICIVVKDLERSMEAYRRILGVEPWRVYTFGPETATSLEYRGKPGNFHMRIGQASVGKLSLELIQPLDGDTVHREFLEKHGEGVQHLGIRLESLEGPVQHMRAAGFQVIQGADGTGASGDGAHVYMDTAEELGIVYELSRPPSRWRADSWYPAPPAEA